MNLLLCEILNSTHYLVRCATSICLIFVQRKCFEFLIMNGKTNGALQSNILGFSMSVSNVFLLTYLLLRQQTNIVVIKLELSIFQQQETEQDFNKKTLEHSVTSL